MADKRVLLASEFDANKISYSVNSKQLSNGGRCIYINYDNGMFRMQTPIMKTPFGVSLWPSDNGGPEKYSLNFSFDGHETIQEIKEFFGVMTTLDEKLVSDGMTNHLVWFKWKVPSVDVIKVMYNPCVRYSKDKSTGEVNDRYAPTLKLNLPQKEGKFDFMVFDLHQREIPTTDFIQLVQSGRTKGASMMAIIDAVGINFIGTNNFGISWKIRQLQITSMNSVLGANYAFRQEGHHTPEFIDDEHEHPDEYELDV